MTGGEKEKLIKKHPDWKSHSGNDLHKPTDYYTDLNIYRDHKFDRSTEIEWIFRKLVLEMGILYTNA